MPHSGPTLSPEIGISGFARLLNVDAQLSKPPSVNRLSVPINAARIPRVISWGNLLS